MRTPSKPLLLPGGGYRRLKSFQIARLVYDLTCRFVELYVDPASRTCDQMTQAARSGVQNIAEGSVDGRTSRKLELNLTNVARGSLEELKLDYEDFLRRRNLASWPSQHPALIRLRELRISTLADFQEWAAGSRAETSAAYSEIAANGILSLLNLAILLLERQRAAQIRDFERNGGFSEPPQRSAEAGALRQPLTARFQPAGNWLWARPAQRVISGRSTKSSRLLSRVNT